MDNPSDEALVAYLDGELESAERQQIQMSLEGDPGVRDRLAALSQSAGLVRDAYADIVDEPVPERLIAAARGESRASAPHEAEILVLKRPARIVAEMPLRRWSIGLAAAAGLFGIVIGAASGYFASGLLNPVNSRSEEHTS